ncbi:hypothetical protein [Sphingobacterium sp. LRF_L2]|uniref:hypothetical protein n=1 Tax=Sphingobacterium sp. LRF_L2 TaxID=3369421 RepID=UPI003F63C11B
MLLPALSILFRVVSKLTLVFSLFLILACSKNEESTALVDPTYHDLTVYSGFESELDILAKDWQVAYVKDANTGALLLDSTGNPMVLEESGMVEVEGGWLGLRRLDETGRLSIWMKENFSDSTQSILIGLYAAGETDEIRITQHRGKSYKLVHQEVEEIEGSLTFYESNEGCVPLTISNNSNAVKPISIDSVFRDVKSLSTFESDDRAAFDWAAGQNLSISMLGLEDEQGLVWSSPVAYKEGTTEELYLNSGIQQWLNVNPHSNIDLEGRITYAERACKYSFTIQNEETGYRFVVQGVWKQKAVLTSHTIIKRAY